MTLIAVVIHLETVKGVSGLCRQSAVFFILSVPAVPVPVADHQLTDALVVLTTAVPVVLVTVVLFKLGEMMIERESFLADLGTQSLI